MKGSDFFVIGLSFVTGLFAGMYFYTTVFAPEYGTNDAITDVAAIGFLLSGEMYGGCQRSTLGCNVFTLKQTRAYEHTTSYSEDEEAGAVVIGKLSPEAYKALRSAVTVANINALRKSGGRCVSQVDGNDYRYRLILDGEEYFLDTCGTQFTGSALAQQFQALWPVVSVSSVGNGGVFGDGIDTYLEGIIDGWFTYDDK